MKEWKTKLEALSDGLSGQFDERLHSAAAALAESTIQQLDTLARHRMDALVRGAEEAVRQAWVGVVDGMAQAVKEKILGESVAPGNSPGEPGGLAKQATA